MKRVKHIFASITAVVLFSAPGAAFSANPGIMSDRNNECAIYLCLPQGFPGPSCKKPHDLFLERTTKVDSRGVLLFSPLPHISFCQDKIPDDLAQKVDQAQNSTVSYETAFEVHMPAFNKCTRWSPKNEVTEVSYCQAVATTPARVFESKEKRHPYETIEVGDKQYTKHLAPTRIYVDVLVDGEIVGKRYIE